LAGVVGREVRDAAGLLRSLAVAPGRREQGLGRRLADQAEAAARDRGVRELYLLTTTAEAFFARRGFERADRASAPPDLQATAEFHSLCPSSAVCMRKRLV
jgi:amino-acid N-acetyltransferase